MTIDMSGYLEVTPTSAGDEPPWASLIRTSLEALRGHRATSQVNDRRSHGLMGYVRFVSDAPFTQIASVDVDPVMCGCAMLAVQRM